MNPAAPVTTNLMLHPFRDVQPSGEENQSPYVGNLD
jgi:hypothetical protein